MKDRLPVLASIVLAMLVTSMDSTIMNTTMPVVASELGGTELFAWSFASYMIALTVLSPVAGRLSDMYGRKKIFASGILLFLFGSLLCGFSGSMPQLVFFRALQGIGAGILTPFPAIIAGDLFTIEQRGKIQAFFSGMWGLSAILAPILGALFVEYASWRWIFFVNVPICLLSFALLMPYRERYEPKRARIDALGAALFAAGVSLVLAFTVEIEPAETAVCVAAGIVLLVSFFLHERRHPSPIVPLNIFRVPGMTMMTANAFLACVSLFGTSSFIPLFLQTEGYPLFASGFALLGMSIGWMAASIPAGKWIVRSGYRTPLLAGNALLALSGAMLLFLRHGIHYGYVFGSLVVLGSAFGLIFTVGTIGAQQLVDAHQKGISTSLQLFVRNIGTAISVTVMGAFLAQTPNNLYTGIHRMFVYGFTVSLLALASSFAIRTVQSRGKPKGDSRRNATSARD